MGLNMRRKYGGENMGLKYKKIEKVNKILNATINNATIHFPPK